jgi:hypothetical protein
VQLWWRWETGKEQTRHGNYGMARFGERKGRGVYGDFKTKSYLFFANIAHLAYRNQTRKDNLGTRFYGGLPQE